MSEYGFKQLAVDNWLKPDEALAAFATLSADGTTRPITQSEWVSRFLEPKLSQQVPLEVRRLFEVARSSVVYGYFFYPLYTLGCEQLFRVAETAVSYKCQDTGGPKPDAKFGRHVRHLVRKGLISQKEKERWDNIHEMRNITSHPHSQRIWMPAHVERLIWNVAERINGLFRV